MTFCQLVKLLNITTYHQQHIMILEGTSVRLVTLLVLYQIQHLLHYWVCKVYIYIHIMHFNYQFCIFCYKPRHLSITKASSSFKYLDTCHTTSTFITEAFCLSAYLQLFYMTVKVKVMDYIQHKLADIRLVSMTHFNSVASTCPD